MKPYSLRKIFAAVAAAACLVPPAIAEDLDLFTQPAPVAAADAPNILIILDNSANWARNDQGWPVGKQGESELIALTRLMADPGVGTNVNLGLMMFTSGGTDGAYVRYAIRNMTAANKAAFVEMIGTSTCVDSANSLTGGANCILKNFNSASEKINSASTRYSSALFEAFKYFGGWTDPSNADTNLSPNPPNVVSATRFGRQRYAVLDPKADRGAYTDASKTVYAPPIALPPALPGCGKNYIVFIGNGYPSQDDPSQTLLTGIFGDAAVPAPIGNKSNRGANWTKYLNLTDVAEAVGKQNVRTYTIDVFKDHPDADQTTLMRAMAKFGGGKYFEAKSEDAILNALRDIIIEIQAVNSVFASASLPINATNRSQNENQVFIGMFRPDADALPRWYGNLKQFQIGLFGTDAKMADKNGAEAIAASTGFIQACATSFWTTDSGSYWAFSPPSAGTCSSVAGSTNSDAPDGGVVEKGGAGEVLRKSNNPSASAPFTVSRNMFTCSAKPCTGLVAFSTAVPSQAQTGAVDAAEHTNIVRHTQGWDVNNENGDETSPGVPNVTEPRPSIHADIAHSRPLPVNFALPTDPPGTRKVMVYYGANDGVFRAVNGANGKESWSFVAPEHHGKLKRLYKNDPMIRYPIPATPPTATPKDYFFDGSAGVYQNVDNTEVWIFPTQRRGGRMVYAFDVSDARNDLNSAPVFKWAKGCPNPAPDNTGCTGGMGEIGQTWSNPNPAFIKGYFGGTKPVVIMGGGYDACEDVDAAVTTCTAAAKGRRVFILDANDGSVIGGPFVTDRPVAADVTLIDRDFDGLVDHIYAADIGGGIYRIDLVDPQSSPSPLYTPLASGAWTMTKIAATSSGNRKFLFGAAALVANNNVFLAIGTGDRERPLIGNYPYTTPVTNRFYMYIDKFAAPAPTVNLDGGTMTNYTANTTCSTQLAAGQDGWFMDLNAGTGEQVVTSSVIFGGTVFFSTNRPIATVPGTCASNLGEARGYAVNLLNASGVIGTGKLCGGSRSGVFTGGGLPPSPVVGTVPVAIPGGGTKMISVLIGGINLQTGGGSVIGAQEPPIPIQQIRSRIYWYPAGNN